jgi:hypothetical protein
MDYSNGICFIESEKRKVNIEPSKDTVLTYLKGLSHEIFESSIPVWLVKTGQDLNR